MHKTRIALYPDEDYLLDSYPGDDLDFIMVCTKWGMLRVSFSESINHQLMYYV